MTSHHGSINPGEGLFPAFCKMIKHANLNQCLSATCDLTVAWKKNGPFKKMLPCCSGSHLTNDFSIVIQFRWEFHSALIQFTVKMIVKNAHGSTAVLSCHLQNFVAIWYRTTAQWSYTENNFLSILDYNELNNCSHSHHYLQYISLSLSFVKPFNFCGVLSSLLSRCHIISIPISHSIFSLTLFCCRSP